MSVASSLAINERYSIATVDFQIRQDSNKQLISDPAPGPAGPSCDN